MKLGSRRRHHFVTGFHVEPETNPRLPTPQKGLVNKCTDGKMSSADSIVADRLGEEEHDDEQVEDERDYEHDAKDSKRGWWVEMEEVFAKNHISHRWVPVPTWARTNRAYGSVGINAELEATCIEYQALTVREKYNLYLAQCRFPADPNNPESRKRVFVLTRSARRLAMVKPMLNASPCVLPNAKMWFDWLDRCAVPGDKMALQGFLPGSYSFAGIGKFVQNSLAGNAVGVTLTIAIHFTLIAEFGDIL